MPVTMICPNLNCQQVVVAPESARGKIVRCAHCQQTFMVPLKPSDGAPVPNGDAAPGDKKKR